jgi:phage host-nuclease inhibitor protein Gam
MSTPENNSMRWRVDNLERRVENLESANISVLAERLSNQTSEIRELRGTITWMLRTAIGVAVTIVGGVLIFLLTTGPA